MRLLVVIIELLISAVPISSMAEFHPHKSEAVIARMSPAQDVKEYRTEFLQHSYSDEYERMLSGYIVRDGLRAVPYLIEVIDAYDPRVPKAQGQEEQRHAMVRRACCHR
jgi:hypothetical protein